MMRLRLTAIVFAAVLATGAGAWLLLRGNDNAGPLVLQGNVDVRQADLAFKVGGRIRSMLVQEGDAVKAGQTLAVLEKQDFEADLARARGQAAAQSALLAELTNGSRPEEIEQARAQVADYQAALVNARISFRREQHMVAAGASSHANVDLAQANLQETEARLASAKAGLALAVKGPRRERIDAARAQLEQAKAAVALAEQRMTDTTLTAPEDGVILARVREPGTIVGVGDPVYTVVFTHPTWVRAYVAEPNLDRVRPGAKAEVRTDGGRVYHGLVGYVSPLAEFTPKTVQTPEQRPDLVYRLRLVVEDADLCLRQGMPVTVRLLEGR